MQRKAVPGLQSVKVRKELCFRQSGVSRDDAVGPGTAGRQRGPRPPATAGLELLLLRALIDGQVHIDFWNLNRPHHTGPQRIETGGNLLPLLRSQGKLLRLFRQRHVIGFCRLPQRRVLRFGLSLCECLRRLRVLPLIVEVGQAGYNSTTAPAAKSRAASQPSARSRRLRVRFRRIMPSFLQPLVFSVLFPAAQHHKTGSAAQ